MKPYITSPSFLLLYPPSAFHPEDSIKPDGSPGLLYLAGALRSQSYDASILDTTVAHPKRPWKTRYTGSRNYLTVARAPR